MKTRTLTMTSTALLLLAAPAFAGQSSTAEREATRQLNLQASAQVQTSQPQIAAADASAGMPANSPPAAAPTARVESASMDNPDGAAPATLSSIQSPPDKIASANVLDSSGQTIGAVQRVEVTPDGKPTQVAVALTGKDEKMVILDAAAVKYDPSRNEILAPQSGDQIRSHAS